MVDEQVFCTIGHISTTQGELVAQPPPAVSLIIVKIKSITGEGILIRTFNYTQGHSARYIKRNLLSTRTS